MTLLSAEMPSALVGLFESGQADIELLHCCGAALIAERDHMALYGKIVDAAITIARSQFGTMQLVCPQGHPSGHAGKLNLLCSRGLPEESVTFWEWVSPEAHSSCTRALKSGLREIVPDYEEWDAIAETKDLLAFRRTGIRSAQTTPLLSRDGHLLGMISTHWSEPHTPSKRDLVCSIFLRGRLPISWNAQSRRRRVSRASRSWTGPVRRCAKPKRCRSF